MRLLLIIGVGGFLGSISRYLASGFVHRFLPVTFPYGTLTVNIVGTFLIGVIYGLTEKGNLMNNDLRMFLTVGFCGGFTTFSTFANENLSLLRDSEFLYFALYSGLSIALGLVAVYLGNVIVKML